MAKEEQQPKIKVQSDKFLKAWFEGKLSKGNVPKKEGFTFGGK